MLRAIADYRAHGASPPRRGNPLSVESAIEREAWYVDTANTKAAALWIEGATPNLVSSGLTAPAKNLQTIGDRPQQRVPLDQRAQSIGLDQVVRREKDPIVAVELLDAQHPIKSPP